MRDKHYLKKVRLKDCGSISVAVKTDNEHKQTLQELL